MSINFEILKHRIRYTTSIILLFICILGASAQKNKIMNRPYADQKIFHLGFFVGLNAQDLILSHSGAVNDDKSVWFAEIPSYSLGFSVGLVTDRYINQYLNLRATPGIHFGEKRFVFREQNDIDGSNEKRISIKNNYLTLPVHLRFSSQRMNNIRPYVLAGGYISTEIGRKKEPEIKLQNIDYGIELGLGCNLYFPLFKLSPELRFSFGLRDLINHNRSDLTDHKLLFYTNALKSGKSRMITLTFNFE